MRHALVFNAISFITFLLAVFFLWYTPLHLSIEFTGGALMEVKYDKPADPHEIQLLLAKAGIVGAEPIRFGSDQDVQIRFFEIASCDLKLILSEVMLL